LHISGANICQLLPEGGSAKMAKIKLEIDTETTESTRKVQVVTHPKIRVISAISISQLLQDAFTSGVNDNNADIKFSWQRLQKK
jgi:hypothetical protein